MVDIPWLLSDCVLILFYYSTHGWELRFRIIAAFQMKKKMVFRSVVSSALSALIAVVPP